MKAADQRGLSRPRGAEGRLSDRLIRLIAKPTLHPELAGVAAALQNPQQPTALPRVPSNQCAANGVVRVLLKEWQKPRASH